MSTQQQNLRPEPNLIEMVEIERKKERINLLALCSAVILFTICGIVFGFSGWILGLILFSYVWCFWTFVMVSFDLDDMPVHYMLTVVTCFVLYTVVIGLIVWIGITAAAEGPLQICHFVN
jgi:hypothetical protein